MNSPLPKNTSYGVCWDNVQVDTQAKHQGLERQNSFLLWAMTFGVSHRVPTLQLSSPDTIDAADIPAIAFAPSTGDYHQLRDHMERSVALVLNRNLDCLQHLKFDTHLRHEHTEAMNRKSNVVSNTPESFATEIVY